MSRQRGHVLVEVMISSVILLIGIDAVLGQLVQGSLDVSLAVRDQQAAALAAQELERLAQRPTSDWQAHAGAALPPVDCAAQGLPGGTLQTTYGPVTQDSYVGTAVAGARFVPVSVAVSYCLQPPCPAHARVQVAQALRGLDP